MGSEIECLNMLLMLCFPEKEEEVATFPECGESLIFARHMTQTAKNNACNTKKVRLRDKKSFHGI